MNTILFDDENARHLGPFTLTRPASHIRCGIMTIAEKWEIWLDSTLSFHVPPHLAAKYPLNQKENNLFVNGRVMPDLDLVKAVKGLASGQALRQGDTLIAFRAA